MDRRRFLAASSAALVLGKSKLPRVDYDEPSENAEPPEIGRSIQERVISVHTTAEKSDYRLSPTGTLSFKPMGQPAETQICVFVDPSKRAQTMLGIGGALTDASAETFAKLPPARQQELLDAYFDPTKGIGYTLGRTNI
ncbi:MAG: hypothetical protein ACJ8AD_06770, partial [Gemmatimonadaceae bacterium]